MDGFEKMTIEELVGEAYDIGHAHGMNPFRMLEGRPPQRVDDGWGPIAEELERRFKQERIAGLRRAAEISAKAKYDELLMHQNNYVVAAHIEHIIKAEARQLEEQ